MLSECELTGCVFSKAYIFVYIIFSGESTNQTSGKRYLPFPPGLGLILHECDVGCSLLLWDVFISNWAAHWEPPALLRGARAASLLLTPAAEGLDLIHSKHPNERFLSAPCTGWAIFHFQTSGLELESDLSWACTQHTGRRGFLKPQSLHHANTTHLPVTHLIVLSKLHPQGNWAFFFPPTSTAGSLF